MLQTNLKHIQSEAEYNKVINENENVMICCGRMGPMCIPVYATMKEMESEYNSVEFYDNGVWKEVRLKEPTPITQQDLGTGDGVETVFGPLNAQDSSYPVPLTAQSVLVLVENVLQLSTTNYTLEQSTSGNLTGPSAPYADGWYLKFLSAVPNGKTVTVLHNFDK